MKFSGYLLFNLDTGDVTFRKTRPQRSPNTLAVTLDVTVNAAQAPMPLLKGTIDLPASSVDEIVLMSGGEVVGELS